MSARACLFLALGLLLSHLAAAQQLYRWTDEKGRVHVTDTPPPPGAKGVEKRRAPGASPSADSNEPYTLQMARKNAPVTLYSAPECDACNAGRRLLNARGVPFREVSVVDAKQMEELKNAVGGNTVPSIVVGAATQQGFADSIWHGMLDAAGYPKTGILPPRAQAEPAAPAETPPEKPAAAEPEAPASGPYAPGAPRQRQKR